MASAVQEEDSEGEAKEVPPSDEEEEEDTVHSSIKLSRLQWMLLALIDVLGPISSDSYIPNEAAMRKNLDTTSVLTGLTLQLNWLAKGLATLWIGALADSPRWRRKGALGVAFGFYVVGTLGCALTPTGKTDRGIAQLLAFRVVQGVGESGTTVCNAIARDVLDDPSERLRTLSALSALRPLAVMLSPTLGGAMGVLFGWRAVFAALAGLGALCSMGVAFCLPETFRVVKVVLQEEETPCSNDNDDKEGSFRDVLRRLASCEGAYAAAVAGMLLIGLEFAALVSYLSNASQLFEERFGLTTLQTSYVMAGVAGNFAAVNIGLFVALRWRTSRSCSKKKTKSISNDDDPESVPAADETLAAKKKREKKDANHDSSAARILRCTTACLAVPAAGGFACAFGPRALRESWPALVAIVVGLALPTGASFGPSTSVFIGPFPDCAGRASAVLLIFRTVFATGIAQASTDILDMKGIAGFYLLFATTICCTQVAWPLLLPRTTCCKKQRSRGGAPDDNNDHRLTPLLDDDAERGA